MTQKLVMASSLHSSETLKPLSASTSIASPEEQWNAILRYDTSRRQSSIYAPASSEAGNSHLATDRDAQDQQSTTFRKPTKVKRLSLGDDLPHMPEESVGLYPPTESAFSQRNPLPLGAEAAYYSAPVPLDAESGTEDLYGHDDNLTLGRQITPSALKGENAVLVDRELERLRERRPKEMRMRWRVITGSVMLLVLALSAYVLTQYIRAYLSLSPANWFLSDAQDGTQSSPDPLLRTLALIEVVASGIALLGVLASGFYLRMTRRRSCGSHFIWFTAIVSTTINVGLSLANVALIVGWNKQYASKSSDPFANTRDVGQRCNGVWDLDILWSAAKSSLLAKPNDESAASNCVRNPSHTMQMFLIAGGVRLGLFVFLCTIWLICLGRYNATLHLGLASNDTIDESPEMHKLLAGEHGLPSMPVLRDMPGYYDEAFEDEKRGSAWNVHNDDHDEEKLAHMPEHEYSSATLVGQPPKLERFQWQRCEPSQMHEQEQPVHNYGNIARGHHDREQSAGAWSTNIMDRLWSALWGESHTSTPSHTFDAVAREEEDHHTDEFGRHPWQWQHGREGTRLGVHGWFGRDTSGRISEEDEEFDVEGHYDPARLAPAPHGPQHTRSTSQERRSQQERHAAARRVHTNQSKPDPNDPYTNGLGVRSLSRKAAQERSERRKQEQQDRIAFLASLDREPSPETGEVPLPLPKDRRDSTSSRGSNGDSVPPALPVKAKEVRQTGSSGDSLPHMPELLKAPSILTPANRRSGPSSTSAAERLDEEDDSEFWHAPPANRPSDGGGPVFVRQLGKLVRRLSAIESVGSDERSRHPSRTSREPSSASGLY